MLFNNALPLFCTSDVTFDTDMFCHGILIYVILYPNIHVDVCAAVNIAHYKNS